MQRSFWSDFIRLWTAHWKKRLQFWREYQVKQVIAISETEKVWDTRQGLPLTESLQETAQAPRCSHLPCTEHHTSKLLSMELYSSPPTLCPLPHSSLCQLTSLHGIPKRKIPVHLPSTHCWVKQQQLLLPAGLWWLEAAAIIYHYQNSKSSDTDLNLVEHYLLDKLDLIKILLLTPNPCGPLVQNTFMELQYYVWDNQGVANWYFNDKIPKMTQNWKERRIFWKAPFSQCILAWQASKALSTLQQGQK